MSGPADGGTAEQPAVTPTVTTAPAPPRSRWSGIPSHIGPARTSTVVLAVLFLAIGALYLNVRPDPAGAARTTGDSGVVTPADPTTQAPATTPPATTEPPATTSEEPTPTSTTSLRTSTPGGTTTAPPTSGTRTPTTPVPTSEPSLPTAATTTPG